MHNKLLILETDCQVAVIISCMYNTPVRFIDTEFKPVFNMHATLFVGQYCN